MEVSVLIFSEVTKLTVTQCVSPVLQHVLYADEEITFFL